MSAVPADPEIVRRYLLGEATEAEAESIERSYLGREETLQAVLAAEEDLIEDYLDGRLEPGRRQRFERHYLASPPHRRRVAIARGLRARAIRRRRWTAVLPLAAIAAAIVIAVVGTWLLRSGSAPGRVATIRLPALLMRGEGETPTARIGEGVTDVELFLEAGDWRATPPLHVTLSTVEGVEVWRGAAAVSPSGPEGGPRPALSVTIPAARLSANDYVAVLSTAGAGGRVLQRYSFRVLRP